MRWKIWWKMSKSCIRWGRAPDDVSRYLSRLDLVRSHWRVLIILMPDTRYSAHYAETNKCLSLARHPSQYSILVRKWRVTGLKDAGERKLTSYQSSSERKFCIPPVSRSLQQIRVRRRKAHHGYDNTRDPIDLAHLVAASA